MRNCSGFGKKTPAPSVPFQTGGVLQGRSGWSAIANGREGELGKRVSGGGGKARRLRSGEALAEGAGEEVELPTAAPLQIPHPDPCS